MIFKRTTEPSFLYNGLPNVYHGIAKPCEPCTYYLLGALRMCKVVLGMGTLAGHFGRKIPHGMPGMDMAITPHGETISRVHMTFLAHFYQQLSILNAVRDSLHYVLADLQSALYGEVGDHVLATVYTLFQHGHRRAAGGPRPGPLRDSPGASRCQA